MEKIKLVPTSVKYDAFSVPILKVIEKGAIKTTDKNINMEIIVEFLLADTFFIVSLSNMQIFIASYILSDIFI